MNYTFTVFTPTFNRAASIHRVYESLKSQTFRDFEWLIVDDGSEDDTAILVGNWIKETDFPITYMKQNHAGKHVAWNRALQKAQGGGGSLLPIVMMLLFRMLWKDCWRFGKVFQRKTPQSIEASRADALRMKALWLVPRRFLRHGWTLAKRMRNMFISCNMRCGA